MWVTIYYSGSKGVQSSIPLRKEQFINSLYSNANERAGIRTMQYNKNLNAMVVATTNKRLLNNCYTKYKVHPNLVSCTPHDKTA